MSDSRYAVLNQRRHPSAEERYIRGISRQSKANLVDLVRRHAQEHNVRWANGFGPEKWSKDELVAALIRIRRGEEW